jgi:hypothetical protein
MRSSRVWVTGLYTRDFITLIEACLLLSRCGIERTAAIEFALLARFWGRSLCSSQILPIDLAEISLISFAHVGPLTSFDHSTTPNSLDLRITH